MNIQMIEFIGFSTEIHSSLKTFNSVKFRQTAWEKWYSGCMLGFYIIHTVKLILSTLG